MTRYTGNRADQMTQGEEAQQVLHTIGNGGLCKCTPCTGRDRRGIMRHEWPASGELMCHSVTHVRPVRSAKSRPGGGPGQGGAGELRQIGRRRDAPGPPLLARGMTIRVLGAEAIPPTRPIRLASVPACISTGRGPTTSPAQVVLACNSTGRRARASALTHPAPRPTDFEELTHSRTE